MITIDKNRVVGANQNPFFTHTIKSLQTVKNCLQTDFLAETVGFFRSRYAPLSNGKTVHWTVFQSFLALLRKSFTPITRSNPT